jgi:hypothetical protein
MNPGDELQFYLPNMDSLSMIFLALASYLVNLTNQSPTTIIPLQNNLLYGFSQATFNYSGFLY